MSARYSRIPNQYAYSEMEAAFDNSDEDEDLDDHSDEHTQQRRPLVTPSRDSQNSTAIPAGQYDFDRVDYDYPPPGSPPRPSSLALPANAAYGNTNGLVPSSSIERPEIRFSSSRSWINRIFPWMTQGRTVPQGMVGGGSDNDGVFANLMSKPTPPRRIEDEDGVHIVPEETQTEAPPVKLYLCLAEAFTMIF